MGFHANCGFEEKKREKKEKKKKKEEKNGSPPKWIADAIHNDRCV